MRTLLPAFLLLALAAPAVHAQVFDGTSFEEPAAIAGQYVDTGSAAADHALVNNASQPLVNYTSIGGELGFAAFYTNTRGDVGLTDGDFVGVNNFTGTVGAFTDGDQGYELSDCDGKVTVTLDAVDLSGRTDPFVTVDYFVEETGWETGSPSDSIRIWVTLDGATEIDLLNTGGADIDGLGIEGSWRSADADLSGAASAVLRFELDSNSGAESLYLDNIRFSEGAVLPQPGSTAEIFEIQGSGIGSIYNGISAITQDNIVTFVGPEGFFIQTPDARDDADPDTSNGIYVFTSTAPTVMVGDQIDVEGTVVEFFGFTQFTNTGLVISTDSTGNPLPTAVVFDAARPSPDPTTPSCAIEFECYEGMRVTITGGRVCGPNLTFGTDPIAEVAVTAGPNRCFRAPGVEFPGVGGSVPTWDGNPEVFELDPDKLGLANTAFTAGATFSAEGAIGFEFGDYELWPASLSFTPTPQPDPPAAVRERLAGEFLVGSLNFFRLYDDVDDPSDQNSLGQTRDDTVVATAEWDARRSKFAQYIVEILRAPDILGVQEVEGLTVLQALAAEIAALDPAVLYTPQLLEGNDQGTIDVGFLVRDTVQVDAVTQLNKDEIFTFDGSLLNDRPPLQLDATYIGPSGTESAPLTVIVVHQRSLSGIDDAVDGERVRTKRLTQAQSLAQVAQTLQSGDPDRPLILVGDFNAFEFTDGYVDVIGQTIGDFDPAENVLSGPDLVDPNLENLVLRLPAEERYSFNFDGNAQVLDHGLANRAAAHRAKGVDYGRGNADGARIFLDDASTTLRTSDHDGLVVFLTTPEIFADGFESGDFSAWSLVIPIP